VKDGFLNQSKVGLIEKGHTKTTIEVIGWGEKHSYFLFMILDSNRHSAITLSVDFLPKHDSMSFGCYHAKFSQAPGFIGNSLGKFNPAIFILVE
jgi:hypothetical protein